MEITPESLRAITTQFQLWYDEGEELALKEASQILELVGNETSTTGRKTYLWNVRRGRLKKLVGDTKQIRRPKGYEFTIENEDWYDLVAVKRNHIADDEIGRYRDEMRDLGYNYRMGVCMLMEDTLKNGGTAKCFDGKAFFATDHPKKPKESGSGTQSNKLSLDLTGGGTFTTALANFDTAYRTYEEFEDEEGRALGGKPDTLVCAPQLRGVATDICLTKTLPNGGDNKYAGYGVKVMVLQNLKGDGTAWYLTRTTGIRRGLIFQMREGGQFLTLTDISSPNVVFQREFLYGVDCRHGAGYGDPFTWLKSKP